MAAGPSDAERATTTMSRPRTLRDTVLLALWALSYSAIIRLFQLLRWMESRGGGPRKAAGGGNKGFLTAGGVDRT